MLQIDLDTAIKEKHTWSHRILCSSCVFSEFTDFEMWTATQTSQLTLTPNSTSKRRIRWPSQSSESPASPLTLNVPVKFGQIKVLVPQILALLQPVVLYHLLCLCASSSARRGGEERRGREFSDQSAPGEGQRQSQRVQIPHYWIY